MSEAIRNFLLDDREHPILPSTLPTNTGQSLKNLLSRVPPLMRRVLKELSDRRKSDPTYTPAQLLRDLETRLGLEEYQLFKTVSRETAQYYRRENERIQQQEEGERSNRQRLEAPHRQTPLLHEGKHPEIETRGQFCRDNLLSSRQRDITSDQATQEEVKSLKRSLQLATEELHHLKKQARADAVPEALHCVVCMNDVKSVVFLPCRHLCVCGDCSSLSLMRNCPICRAPIQERLTVISS